MSKRKSSKDDLFVSALDLYSLLALAFIAAALVTVRARQPDRYLDLPIASAEVTQAKTGGGWSAIWSPGASSCTVVIKRDGEGASGVVPLAGPYEVPCEPSAFSGGRRTNNALTQQIGKFKDMNANQAPTIALDCDRNKWRDCSAMQWTLALAGATPIARVEESE